MTSAISIRNVTKRLGSSLAVDNVSLDVMTGETVVVLGPSGSGKTTLLRLIAGLETPDSGEVWLDSVQVSTASRTLVAPHERGVGFVFQDLALWPHLTVAQQLDFVLGSARVPRSERPAKIRDCLAIVRIDHLATRHPHELSGGEQQRAALARALVAHPRLVLLDEPFSNLDPELRAQLRNELVRVRAVLSATMIYVTHDQDDAAIADRTVRMAGGRLSSAIVR